MAKTKHEGVDTEVLAVYRAMVESVQGQTVKGDKSPYTSLNGNMFSSISKMNVIGVRLPKDAREAFIEENATTLFEPFPGFTQKEYVAIPEEMMSDGATLAALFAQSFAYASTLKPKKTTK